MFWSILQSEAPLLVRPYLPTVTKSELHAIMTCGFSSISGAFMAMFIKAGVRFLSETLISVSCAVNLELLRQIKVSGFGRIRTYWVKSQRARFGDMPVFVDFYSGESLRA